MTARIRKAGLHIYVFTRGLPIDGVLQIRQNDGGGALWIRIKIRKTEDLPLALQACKIAAERMSEAEKLDESTSWWAQKNIA